MKINNPFETYTRGMTARERRIRSKWALMFVVSSLIAIWSTIKYYNEVDDLETERAINTGLQTQTVRMINTIDSLKRECKEKDSLLTKKGITALIDEKDSLRSELFVCGVQLQRWEWAFEIFKEREPKPAQRFGLIHNQETE
jgi:hypothetical protein